MSWIIEVITKKIKKKVISENNSIQQNTVSVGCPCLIYIVMY